MNIVDYYENEFIYIYSINVINVCLINLNNKFVWILTKIHRN